MNHRYPLGPTRLPNDAMLFLVWAPNVQQVELHLLRQDIYITMQRDDKGYHACTTKDVLLGDRYLYRLDGEKERPDPATRAQPEGVHGPSMVVDADFEWTDQHWNPPTLRNTVIYELHVGTFTQEGTFEAIIPHLQRLHDLGITTLELMPIAQFPGARNWGYDGVNLFAPHHDYGGLQGLMRLVNAAHETGLAVLLDVVYNHFGPEGNYLWDYAPYFTDRYHTPWGDAVNYDGAHSDEVRRYFIENALFWLNDCHIDGLRLDATHAIFDFSAHSFLAELVERVDDWASYHNRRVHLIAETERGDRRMLLPREANGIGLDGQWLDEVHHLLHVALTDENDGYYADYQNFALLPKVLDGGYAYTGEYSVVHKRRQGTFSRDIPTDRFVICSQNHDQVGNRMLGERLGALTDFDGLKLAAGLLLTTPYVPLLFMGQEYAETAPFLYFVSHGDPDLVQAVREGRKAEFAAFAWKGTPPDPDAEETFKRSKLNHDLRKDGHHAIIYRLYKTLLDLRKYSPTLTNPDRRGTRVYADVAARIIGLDRRGAAGAFRMIYNLNTDAPATLTLPADGNTWRKYLDSAAADWQPDSASGATAADTLPSNGTVPITLPRKSFVIYTLEVK